MGIAIINTYLVLLFLLVHFKIVPFNLFWKLSPFLVLLLTLFGLLVPMGWGAPQGSTIVVRNAVSIVPNVAGEVIDIPVTANTPLKAGDVLFKIDPTPYEAQVKTIEAQLKLSSTRLSQMTTLYERDAGRGFDVEQRQSEVDQLKGNCRPRSGTSTRPSCVRRPTAMSPTSRCARARVSPICRSRR